VVRVTFRAACAHLVSWAATPDGEDRMRRLLQVTANEDNKNVDFQVLSGIVSDYHAQVCVCAVCVRCVRCVRCVCGVCGVKRRC